jgi:hypothetical protein
MEQKEAELERQMESARTHSDRQLCELRRELSKAYDANSEAVEKLERKHAEELGEFVAILSRCDGTGVSGSLICSKL